MSYDFYFSVEHKRWFLNNVVNRNGLKKRKEHRAANWQQLTRVITTRQQMCDECWMKDEKMTWSWKQDDKLERTDSVIVFSCVCVCMMWVYIQSLDRQQFLQQWSYCPPPIIFLFSPCFFLSHWNAPHAFVSPNEMYSSGVDSVCRINVSLEARERGDRAPS